MNRIGSRAATGLLLLSFIFSACNNGNNKSKAQDQVYVFGGPAQGTTYVVKYHGAGLDDVQESVDSILAVIDQSLSTYIEQSTISRFNRQDEIVTNDEHFIRMVFESKDIRDLSGGAFEPAVMPLVRAWGFGPEGPRPEQEVPVDSLLTLVDWDFEVKISNQTDAGNHRSTTLEILKNKPVELDFNGIAQGYSVDVVFEFLKSRGIQNMLVEIGGETRASGVNDQGNPWLIGIDQPDETSERGSQARLKLMDKAVATSGNYRKYYERDGKKYSHTIDPVSGYPVSHQLLSATVVASNAALADAVATVFMVYGPDKSIEFLKSEKGENLEAYLIFYNESGELETYISDGLTELLEEIPAIEDGN